jgi:hypothetical protein
MRNADEGDIVSFAEILFSLSPGAIRQRGLARCIGEEYGLVDGYVEDIFRAITSPRIDFHRIRISHPRCEYEQVHGSMQ